MHTGPTPRHFQPFTSQRTQMGLASSFAANHPRELPKPLNEKPSLTPRVLTMAIALLIIIGVLVVLTVGFFLFGQQWRSGADAAPEPHEAAAPSRPYQWGTENE